MFDRKTWGPLALHTHIPEMQKESDSMLECGRRLEDDTACSTSQFDKKDQRVSLYIQT